MWKKIKAYRYHLVGVLLIVMYYPLIIHPIYGEKIKEEKHIKNPIHFEDKRTRENILVATTRSDISWQKEMMLANVLGYNFKAINVDKIDGGVIPGEIDYLITDIKDEEKLQNIIKYSKRVIDFPEGETKSELRYNVLESMSGIENERSNYSPKCYVYCMEDKMLMEKPLGESRSLKEMLEHSINFAKCTLVGNSDEADFIIVLAQRTRRSEERNLKSIFLKTVTRYKAEKKPMVFFDFSEQIDEDTLYFDFFSRKSYLTLGDIIAYVGWGNKEAQLDTALMQAASWVNSKRLARTEETKRYIDIENKRLVVLNVCNNYIMECFAVKALAGNRSGSVVGEENSLQYSSKTLLEWMRWKVKSSFMGGVMGEYAFDIGEKSLRVKLQRIDVDDCIIYPDEDYDIKMRLEFVKE